jgi:hypothetical protein
MRAGFNGTGYIQQRFNPRAHHNAAAANPMANAAMTMAAAQNGGQFNDDLAAVIQQVAAQHQAQEATPSIGGMMDQAHEQAAMQALEGNLGMPAIFAHLKGQGSVGTPGPVRSVLDKVRNNRGALAALIQQAMASHMPGRMLQGGMPHTGPMQRPPMQPNNQFAPGANQPNGGGYTMM